MSGRQEDRVHSLEGTAPQVGSGGRLPPPQGDHTLRPQRGFEEGVDEAKLPSEAEGHGGSPEPDVDATGEGEPGQHRDLCPIGLVGRDPKAPAQPRRDGLGSSHPHTQSKEGQEGALGLHGLFSRDQLVGSADGSRGKDREVEGPHQADPQV